MDAAVRVDMRSKSRFGCVNPHERERERDIYIYILYMYIYIHIYIYIYTNHLVYVIVISNTDENG